MSLQPAAFSSSLWLQFSEQLSWTDDMLLPKGGDLIPYPFYALWEFLPGVCQAQLLLVLLA